MEQTALSRRHFIRGAAAFTAGAVTLRPSLSRAADAPKRTATDIVTLGKTGIKLSRLGIGTGVNNGQDQIRMGQAEFNKMIRHAYDQGITYLDCARGYRTFGWMGEAIKGIPREKLFIQTKIVPNGNQDVMAELDAHRKNFNTDYIDSVLVHCQTDGKWADTWKSMMDVYDQAKEKKWIHSKGVSCHSVEALTTAATNEWSEVHLVRVNPQGIVVDGPDQRWSASAKNPVQPVLDQIKVMHDKGRGIIGMKIFGNGFITDAAEREKSVRFAMSNPQIHAIVIGMTSIAQVNENIAMINKVLADLPVPA